MPERCFCWDHGVWQTKHETSTAGAPHTVCVITKQNKECFYHIPM